MNNWKNIFLNSYFSILIIGLVSVLLVTQFSWKGNDSKGYSRIISSDGIGYYYYLPNTFLKNTIDKQSPDNRFFNEVNEKGVNKYYVGTAIAMYPFYQLGFYGNSDKSVSGFEPSFHKAISIAGIFYLIVGLLFFRAFLNLYSFREIIVSTSIILLFFGTNLMAYSVLMPSMSHVYSFCFITAFLFFSKKFIVHNKSITLFLGVACLSMVILIRPLNGIIFFVLPFLAGSWEDTKQLVFQLFKPLRVIVSLLILFSILFIQSYFWYLQCGQWMVWSYGKEGFYFLHPSIIEVLFSFRKGAFIYTPILLLSILGLVALWKKNKFQGVSLFLFFGILVYLVSSWWNWYYGPSFGQRPFVEFYGLSVFLIAYFIQAKKAKWKSMVWLVFAIGCVGLNTIQTYQYHRGIISSWDMNFEKYGYSFLKMGKKYENVLGGNQDIMLYDAEIKEIYSQVINFESEIQFASFGNVIKELENSNLASNYTNQEFNFELTIPTNNSFVTERGIYLKVNFDYKDLKSSFENNALFVVDISDSLGVNYRYGTFQIRDVPPVNYGEWKRQEYTIEIQEKIGASDKIKLYIWNQGKQSFLLDNFEVNVLAID